MKTIIVIYTNVKVKEIESKNIKRYAFNVAASVIENNQLKVGDMLKSSSYTTKMQVVKILDRDYLYYNFASGEMSNDYNSTSQYEIKTLELRDTSNDVVIASVCNE